MTPDTPPLLPAKLGAIYLRRHTISLLLALSAGAIAGWGAAAALSPSFRSESSHAVVTNAGSGTSALAGLAALPGLSGTGGGRVNLDQAIALIQTNDTLDALVAEYRLGTVWNLDDPEKLRRKLQKHLRLWIGQKDQLVRIEAMMPQAGLAAAISNDLGRRLAERTTELASAEAKNRRQTLEAEVRRTQAALQAAQQKLSLAQISPSQLRADSRGTAEQMARVQSELGAIEVRLAAASTQLTPDSAEIRQMTTSRDALRGRLETMRRPAQSADFGYTEAFREFKYQETVLEVLLRQYETARIDEVKGGQYVHPVQLARAAQKPVFPDPLIFAVSGALSLALLYGISVFLRQRFAPSA